MLQINEQFFLYDNIGFHMIFAPRLGNASDPPEKLENVAGVRNVLNTLFYLQLTIIFNSSADYFHY